MKTVYANMCSDKTNSSNNVQIKHSDDKTDIFFHVKVLAEVIVAENVSKLMLPTVISLAQDAVANVRFNVAKTLQKIGPKIESG